jgi:hypothetical protein
MLHFARIHGGLQSADHHRGRGHDACELYLLQDQGDNGTGKICVAKGIGNAVHYGFLAGNIPGQDGYPAWLPSGKVDRYIAEEKRRLRGDQNEAKRLDDILFLTLAGFMRTESAG